MKRHIDNKALIAHLDDGFILAEYGNQQPPKQDIPLGTLVFPHVIDDSIRWQAMGEIPSSQNHGLWVPVPKGMSSAFQCYVRVDRLVGGHSLKSAFTEVGLKPPLYRELFHYLLSAREMYGRTLEAHLEPIVKRLHNAASHEELSPPTTEEIRSRHRLGWAQRSVTSTKELVSEVIIDPDDRRINLALYEKLKQQHREKVKDIATQAFGQEPTDAQVDDFIDAVLAIIE